MCLEGRKLTRSAMVYSGFEIGCRVQTSTASTKVHVRYTVFERGMWLGLVHKGMAPDLRGVVDTAKTSRKWDDG